MQHDLTLSAVKFGWATDDITPDQPVQLQGQAHERISTHVEDRLTITALAIESASGEQAILVSCDLISVVEDDMLLVRARLAELLPDFDASKMTLSGTHTHTAPTMRPHPANPEAHGVMNPRAYAAWFIEKAAQTAATAWRNRQPGGMSRGLGHAAIGFNRRMTYADGRSQMYGPTNVDDFTGPEGGMDPGVELLFIHDDNDRLTGMVVNLACPSQVVEGECFVSADFWTPARAGIRAALGEDVRILPMCSAAGDISPRDLIRGARAGQNMRSIAGMNELGRRLALAVTDAWEHNRTDIEREMAFAHVAEDLPLPRRAATEAELAAAREVIEQAGRDGDASKQRWPWQARRAQRVLDSHAAMQTEPDYTIHTNVLRLGDVALATNPFELYLNYGLRIKARSRAAQTLVAQLTNGRGAYLPTPAGVKGGHYSGTIYENIVGPEGGEKLVERQVELINAMWPETA